MKRKIIMLLSIAYVLLLCSVVAYAKEESFDGIMFEVPDEWEEIERTEEEDGSIYVKYDDGCGNPEFFTVLYPEDTSVVDDTLFDAAREELRKISGYEEISTSVNDVNDIRQHFTFFYIGDDTGMLSSYDTGKSILNLLYMYPDGSDYEITSKWAKMADNPARVDETENDKMYSISEDQQIASVIKSRVSSKYTDTDITEITVNENAGTDVLDDYVALVYLKWNVKNTASTSEEMLSMYSNDLAAYLAEECLNVSEVAIFWEVPYLTENTSKWSFERRGENMYLTDNALGW